MLHLIRKTTLVLLSFVVYYSAFGQSVSSKLSLAFQALEADAQMQAGIASIYVADAKTGAVIFEKNSTIGLATASTMKVITSVSAYELLGKNFRYKTEFGYTGKITKRILAGDLFIRPSGDPTLGSWRWEQTKEDRLLQRIQSAFNKTGIQGYNSFKIETTGWENEGIPDGWMWQDIGNYYGAGAHRFNWRENQYDIVLASGQQIGSPVKLVRTKPENLSFSVSSVAKAAAKGTGDNAYVYYPLAANYALVRGTIPVDEKAFTISAALPNASLEFTNIILRQLSATRTLRVVKYEHVPSGEVVFHTETSPPLDSIIYWFNKKSINLYGEALVKTIAFKKRNNGDTDEGVEVIKEFWKDKGLDVRELNMVDGSGLSPLNRVSTRAQVFILQYAQKQPWYNGFYHSLPEYNGMKLKSGTIRGVKGFCGYHKSAAGNEYIVSMLVNNYNGSASSIVQKMYSVLDVLK